jgi:hypothetical protein
MMNSLEEEAPRRKTITCDFREVAATECCRVEPSAEGAVKDPVARTSEPPLVVRAVSPVLAQQRVMKLQPLLWQDENVHRLVAAELPAPARCSVVV